MNRAFQAINSSSATLHPWHSPSFSTLTLQDTSSLSSQLPVSLNVATDSSINGTVSIANPGYWGIDVRPQDYQGSFYVRGAYQGDFTVSLVSYQTLDAGNTAETFAATIIQANSTTDQWTQYNFTLSPLEIASTTNNSLQIEFDGAAATDGSLNFNLISLFPPTYKNRTNGMRVDLMEAWADLNPSFLRAPGGNNIEGLGPAEYSPRWKWNETIGPVTERPGHLNAWGYVLTDGMGLNEYFQLAADLNMDMVLSVFAGHYLDGSSISNDSLAPYIQETLNEIEYLTASASNSTLGALRASHGYPEPWPVKYVEIGNEDNLSNGSDSYISYRYEAYHKALSAAYPDITLMASTQYVPVPDGQISDYHIYDTPDGLVSRYNYFDANSTQTSTMIGEFAAVDYNSPAGADVDAPTIPNPFWQGTVAEAVFLIGTERNSNKVFGAAYAPSLSNRNSEQWRTNLIYFDADTDDNVLSTSHHMISLFSNTRMTTTRSVRTTVPAGPVYWVAGENEGTGAHIAKFAVYNSTSTATHPTPYVNGTVPVALSFDAVAAGTLANLTVLTAPSWNAFNEVGRNVVQSTSTTVTADQGGVFAFELPDLSVAVLETQVGNGTKSDQLQQQLQAGVTRKRVMESEDGVLFTT